MKFSKNYKTLGKNFFKFWEKLNWEKIFVNNCEKMFEKISGKYWEIFKQTS